MGFTGGVAKGLNPRTLLLALITGEDGNRLRDEYSSSRLSQKVKSLHCHSVQDDSGVCGRFLMVFPEPFSISLRMCGEKWTHEDLLRHSLNAHSDRELQHLWAQSGE